MRFQGPCTICNETDPTGYYKKRMCNNCYRKQRRRERGLKQGGYPAKTGPCTVCGSTTSSDNRFVKGMCRTCYKRIQRGGNTIARSRYPGPCVSCGTTDPGHIGRFTKKMCWNCYKRDKYESTVKTQERYCVTCNKQISRLSKTGLCRSCRHKDRYRSDPEYYALFNTDRLERYGVKDELTAEQWQRVLEYYDYRCAYCDKQLGQKVTIDHVIPVSRGGKHSIDNVVPACRSCNSKKRDRPPSKPVMTLIE